MTSIERVGIVGLEPILKTLPSSFGRANVLKGSASRSKIPHISSVRRSLSAHRHTRNTRSVFLKWILIMICGVVMYSCSTTKEGASGGDGGEFTTNTGGSGAVDPGNTESGQGGVPSSTGGADTGGSGTTTDSPNGAGSSIDQQECGNGILEGNEQCDCGPDSVCSAQELNNATCASLGNGSGSLGCDKTCMLDTSMCTASGDSDAGPYGTDSEPLDCDPVEYANPGNVPNPDLVPVAPDAGTTGHVFGGAWGMEEYDYVEEEFLFSGTSPQAYTTRMVVRRPRDMEKFTGTVYLEWLNVSGLMDVAVMWGTSRDYFMREGHVHVGVSAQLMGIGTLQSYDPERYVALNHPGDQASDAIFSQAAMAIRTQSELLLRSCKPVTTVLGIGQSQSAMRLAAYVNVSQSVYQIYDGFLIHSGPEPSTNNPPVPVFMIHTMTEGNCALGDGPNEVCWAVAGSTHNDDRILDREIDEVGSCFGLSEAPFECINPLNEFPSWRVYNAALDWLNRWVRDGERPPAGVPFVGNPPLSATDEHGNALGGVRLPDIDVPIATHDMNNGPVNGLDFIALLACGLSGNSVYFPEDKLLQLYPTHEDYVNQYTAAADQAVEKGYLLQADYEESVQEAQAAPIPN